MSILPDCCCSWSFTKVYKIDFAAFPDKHVARVDVKQHLQAVYADGNGCRPVSCIRASGRFTFIPGNWVDAAIYAYPISRGIQYSPSNGPPATPVTALGLLGNAPYSVPPAYSTLYIEENACATVAPPALVFDVFIKTLEGADMPQPESNVYFAIDVVVNFKKAQCDAVSLTDQFMGPSVIMQ